jgi:hypothetical protein
MRRAGGIPSTTELGARVSTFIADQDLAQDERPQPAEFIQDQHMSKASSFTPGS